MGRNLRQWNAAGRILTEWAAEQNLVLINTEFVSTCVRPRKEPVIDLTWASSSAAQIIVDMTMDEEGETLYNHRYIG